jgi:hypothetical protein
LPDKRAKLIARPESLVKERICKTRYSTGLSKEIIWITRELHQPALFVKLSLKSGISNDHHHAET